MGRVVDSSKPRAGDFVQTIPEPVISEADLC